MDLFILYIEIHVWYITNYKLLGMMLRINKIEKSKNLSPRATFNNGVISLILKFKIIQI